MGQLLHQIVGAITALSVLACSIACVCPTWAGAVSTPAQHTSAHEHADHTGGRGHHHGSSKKSDAAQPNPCHSSEKTATDSGGEAPADPCDHGNGGGGSCGHCDATAIVTVETASVSLAPHLATPFFSPGFFHGSVPTSITRPLLVTTGVPPPAERTTLLRLHCALII